MTWCELCCQALEWIHETGEFYLSTHTETGNTQDETDALLKEHNEFKSSAKVIVLAMQFLSFMLIALSSINV